MLHFFQVFELSKKYTSEFVARYGWGIESDGFSKESVVRKLFDTISFVESKALVLQLLHPFLSYWLKLRYANFHYNCRPSILSFLYFTFKAAKYFFI